MFMMSDLKVSADSPNCHALTVRCRTESVLAAIVRSASTELRSNSAAETFVGAGDQKISNPEIRATANSTVTLAGRNQKLRSTLLRHDCSRRQRNGVR